MPDTSLRIDLRWEAEPGSSDATLIHYLKTHPDRPVKSLILDAVRAYYSLEPLQAQLRTGELDQQAFQFQMYGYLMQLASRIALGCFAAQIELSLLPGIAPYGTGVAPIAHRGKRSKPGSAPAPSPIDPAILQTTPYAEEFTPLDQEE